MNRKEILDCLLSREGDYISGAELASLFSVSRSAVWKEIQALRREGYTIDSVTNRGYRLLSSGDLLSEAVIRKHLKTGQLELRIFDRIDSTNTALKKLAAEGAGAGLALIAGEQSAGRGRMGRSFFSPPGCGVYLSLLLRPRLPAREATKITACAAVAVAETLEELSGKQTRIKWVNDVFMDGKKTCGILTEAALDCESSQLDYAVVGIGVNVREPAGGFPPELRDIAGAAFGQRESPELRCRVAAGILDRLWTFCEALPEDRCFEAYRSRSLVLGREVELLSPGADPVPARILELLPDYSLLAELPDGSRRRVFSGEVRIRPV